MTRFPKTIANPTEKSIERMCIQLYEKVGCLVLKFSQPRKTMQSYGIPDLKVYNLRHGKTWWHEVKRPKGKLSDHQKKVREMAIACGEAHYVGGLDAAKDALAEQIGLTIV